MRGGGGGGKAAVCLRGVHKHTVIGRMRTRAASHKSSERASGGVCRVVSCCLLASLTLSAAAVWSRAPAHSHSLPDRGLGQDCSPSLPSASLPAPSLSLSCLSLCWAAAASPPAAAIVGLRIISPCNPHCSSSSSSSLPLSSGRQPLSAPPPCCCSLSPSAAVVLIKTPASLPPQVMPLSRVCDAAGCRVVMVVVLWLA